MPRAVVAVLGLLGAGAAGWFFLGVYSPGNPDAGLVGPVREYLTAAAEADSGRMVGQGVGPGGIERGLLAGRTRAEFLRTLGSGLRLQHSADNGPKSVLYFTASALSRCGDWPLIVFATRASPGPARIEDVRFGCERR